MAKHLYLIVRLSAAVLAAKPTLLHLLATAITDRGYHVGSPSGESPAIAGEHAELHVHKEHHDSSPSVVQIQLTDEAPPGDAVLAIILPVGTTSLQQGPALERVVLGRLDEAGLLVSQSMVPDERAPGDRVYSDAEESVVAQRLAALGYIE